MKTWLISGIARLEGDRFVYQMNPAVYDISGLNFHWYERWTYKCSKLVQHIDINNPKFKTLALKKNGIFFYSKDLHYWL